MKLERQEKDKIMILSCRKCKYIDETANIPLY